MATKPHTLTEIVETKTFWGGLGAIAIGAALFFAGDVPEGISLIANGILAIFIRDGILKK